MRHAVSRALIAVAVAASAVVVPASAGPPIPRVITGPYASLLAASTDLGPAR